MNTKNKIITKIAEAPATLTLDGNQVIALAVIAVVGVCIAMLFNYRIEFGSNGLVMTPLESNTAEGVA